MSQLFSRLALPVIIFAVLMPLISIQQSAGQGPPANYGQTSQVYNPSNYIQHYPTQAGMDKSIMSYYGGDVQAAGQSFANLDTKFEYANNLLNANSHDTNEFETALTDLIQAIDDAVNAEEKLAKEFPGQSLSFELGRTWQGNLNTTVVPDLTYSNGFWGADMGFQEYTGVVPGYGFSIKFYPGPERQHYSDELISVFHDLAQAKSEAAVLHGLSQQISAHQQQDKGNFAELIKDLSKDFVALSADIKLYITLYSEEYPMNDTYDEPSTEDELVRAIVNYSTGLNTSIYVLGRHINRQGLLAVQGVSAGRIIPLGTTGLSPSILAQTVQFYSNNSAIPSGADGQYGLVLVWQDQTNGFRKDKSPVLRNWHVKVGYEYYSKAFGQSLATPDSHDFFLRYRFVGATPFEIKPYIGWAGLGHKQYSGVELGYTFRVSF